MATRKNSKPDTLEDLFVTKLKALYDIELQLLKALPKMAKAARDSELKKGFNDHLKETEEHVARLENIFEMVDMKPGKTKIEAIRGMIADTEWLIKNVKDPDAKDAGLIAAGQYAEHYEMAGYGTAKEWAKLLGLNEAEDLLEETLKEEKAADSKLNNLATARINEQAMANINRAVL